MMERNQLTVLSKPIDLAEVILTSDEPHREKTRFLPMRKERRRSAVQ